MAVVCSERILITSIHYRMLSAPPKEAPISSRSPFCLPPPLAPAEQSGSGFACSGRFTQRKHVTWPLVSGLSQYCVCKVHPHGLTCQLHSFLWLSNVPRVRRRPHLCLHSPAGGHWGCFHFGAVTESCCKERSCTSFSVNTFPIPLGG